MTHFAQWIVKHKKFTIFICVMLSLLCGVGMLFVNVNYDLSSYLPNEMNANQGTEILSKEFDIRGTAKVILKTDDIRVLSEAVEALKAIPAIRDVVWLGSVEDLYQPIEFMNPMIQEQFIAGDHHLILLNFFEPDDYESTVVALNAIDTLPYDLQLSGAAVSSRDFRTIADREMPIYSIVALIVIFLILLISMKSWMEPLIFLVSIGFAILLNMGTNALMDGVSYMTHSIAPILQLAVSLDYSIFLLHRFNEEKTRHNNHEDAMVAAIQKTFIAILSSSLTTVAGFMALLVMQFGIGKDIGLVLSKGVFFSLLTVVTLLPVLLLYTEKRVRHFRLRIFSRNFQAIAVILNKAKYVLLILAVLLAYPTFVAQMNIDYYYDNEKALPDEAVSVVGAKILEKEFRSRNQLVLLVPKGEKMKEKQFLGSLESIESVKSVHGLRSIVDIKLADFMIPEDIRAQFESENYTLINLVLHTPMEGLENEKALQAVREKAGEYYPEYYLTGESAIYMDLSQVTSRDFKFVNLISILFISLIILLAFRSVSIPLLLVFLIEMGIWLNLSIDYFIGTPLNFISFIIIGAIQLGATVDYAILFTTRYRENLICQKPEQAAFQTIKDTGSSILTSAMILFLGTFSITFLTSIKTTKELTLLIGRGALISMLLVFTVLPAMLVLCQKVISKTTLGWIKKGEKVQ